ncbi:MAG TPA: FKBP-type peptidyl-prolyl cis-trans isomerase [Solirubrobacterales bacterium]|nr:FKBP-type peptidyl-prolyl cis-trans isomerase [Solirubrobacterales bacterium]
MTVVAVLAVFGCGGSSGTSSSVKPASQAEAATTTTASETEAGYPVPQAPPHKGPLKKLVVRDIKVGTGPVARWGDEAAVRYVGLNYETGKVYVRHWKGLEPLFFELDRKSFGIGWQKGIEGMRVGGRRELQIPKHLLFNDEDVAYVVELLRASRSKATADSFPAEGSFLAVRWAKGKKPRFRPPARPAPKKLVFRDLSVGRGAAAHRGDEVDIEYIGAVYETGELRYGGTTQPFPLGSGGLGEAFERGLEGMEPGGRRELIVPSRLLGGTPAIDYVIRMESVKPTK